MAVRRRGSRSDGIEIGYGRVACVRQRQRWTDEVGRAHACGPGRIQFFRDVAEEKDLVRWQADSLGDTSVGVGLALVPGPGIEIAREQGRQVARFRETE